MTEHEAGGRLLERREGGREFSFVHSNLIWKRRICILEHHIAVAVLQASTSFEKKNTQRQGSKQTGTHIVHKHTAVSEELSFTALSFNLFCQEGVGCTVGMTNTVTSFFHCCLSSYVAQELLGIGQLKVNNPLKQRRVSKAEIICFMLFFQFSTITIVGC